MSSIDDAFTRLIFPLIMQRNEVGVIGQRSSVMVENRAEELNLTFSLNFDIKNVMN